MIVKSTSCFSRHTSMHIYIGHGNVRVHVRALCMKPNFTTRHARVYVYFEYTDVPTQVNTMYTHTQMSIYMYMSWCCRYRAKAAKGEYIYMRASFVQYLKRLVVHFGLHMQIKYIIYIHVHLNFTQFFRRQCHKI